MKILFFLLNSIILGIGGCALYTKPVVPPVNIPPHFKFPVQSYRNLKNDWWVNFNDRKLNRLVSLAIKNNYKYQIAIRNIDIAITYVTQYHSALFPQVNLNYNISRNKSRSISNQSSNISTFNTSQGTNTTLPAQNSRTFNFEELYASLSYQLDVWHQLTNTVNQAIANIYVREKASQVIRLTLISDVVNTYFQITSLTANLNNLKNQYQTAQELVSVTETQLKSGLIDGSILDDVKNQLENIKNTIASIQKQKEILINMLAYLLGEYPEYFKFTFDTAFKNYGAHQLIPPGIPSRMALNRPDIQEAYFQVIAAAYYVKINLANFFPSFLITANYGYATTQLGHLISPSNVFWNYGLNVVQPLIDFGLRHSEYKRSKLQGLTAFLTYKNTAIQAFQEIDNALVSYQKDQESEFALQNLVNNSKDKVQLANAQYRSGLGDYSTYLNDQLAFLQNSYTLTNQKLALNLDIVQVYKALGLGLGYSIK